MLMVLQSGDRTHDLQGFSLALSQLSYRSVMEPVTGIEPAFSYLQGTRIDQRMLHRHEAATRTAGACGVSRREELAVRCASYAQHARVAARRSRNVPGVWSAVSRYGTRR
jgi:hypothetical protein